MSIKESLLKDLKENLGGDPYRRIGLTIDESERVALWAAQWALEKAAKETERFQETYPIVPVSAVLLPEALRQMGKELS